MAYLEHANITVADPRATAALLSDLFDWHTRWEGAAMNGAGYTVHVGNDRSYLALYSGTDPKQTVPSADASYETRGALNHLAVVVDDLDATQAKIEAKGYKTINHADYEPGRRFYFHEDNGVEIEVVSYA